MTKKETTLVAELRSWIEPYKTDGLDALLELAAVEIERLEKRLEVWDASGTHYLGIGDTDGIGCRDETIKAQDARIERQAQEIERLKHDLSRSISNHVDDLNRRAAPLLEAPKPVWDVPSGWRGEKPWFSVGDRVLPRNGPYRWYPVHIVMEITERGFKYTHERIWLGTRLGWTEGGETFEPSGYDHAASSVPVPSE